MVELDEIGGIRKGRMSSVFMVFSALQAVSKAKR
jgi:hypothetical protein